MTRSHSIENTDCGIYFVAFSVLFITPSILYFITTNSQWEGIVSKHTIIVAPHRNILRTRRKKPTVSLKSSAPPNHQHPRAAQLTSHVRIELKKDPRVPRLPNLKVRGAEMQRRRSVCIHFRPCCLHLPAIDTPSTRGAFPSQSPPHAPLHEDATMVSEPTLSSLAQLAASASANDLMPAPSESTSAATKTKE